MNIDCWMVHAYTVLRLPVRSVGVMVILGNICVRIGIGFSLYFLLAACLQM